MKKQELIIQARSIDLIIFLGQYKGLHFAERNGEYRCKEHPSLAIKHDHLSWFWHSKNIGGYGALDFLIKVDSLDFLQAVSLLISDNLIPAPMTPVIPWREKKLQLPPKANSVNRVLAYLCKTRGLDSGIVKELIQRKMLYQDTRGNAVFIGFDENNTPRFACLRGTYSEKQFRRDCLGSDKKYGFHISFDTAKLLYIFESPIDAISHATLEILISRESDAHRYDSRLSLGGTSDIALAHYLSCHRRIEELVFCLDSDDAGRSSAIGLARKYTKKGYITRLELPQRKDYNEALLYYQQNKIHKKSEVHHER